MLKNEKTMDKILIILGITVLIFTIIMIYLYLITGGIPDTLCTCFFVACTGECGFMGLIKSTKEKYRDRAWKKEDQVEQEKKQAAMIEALSKQEID